MEENLSASEGNPSPKGSNESRFPSPVRSQDRPMLVRMKPPRAILEHQPILQTTGYVVYGNERPFCCHEVFRGLSAPACSDVLETGEKREVAGLGFSFPVFWTEFPDSIPCLPHFRVSHLSEFSVQFLSVIGLAVLFKHDFGFRSIGNTFVKV